MVYRIKKEMDLIKDCVEDHVGIIQGVKEMLGIITFKFGQLSAIAYRDTSVTKVPPMFKFCKELALEILEHKKI